MAMSPLEDEEESASFLSSPEQNIKRTSPPLTTLWQIVAIVLAATTFGVFATLASERLAFPLSLRSNVSSSRESLGDCGSNSITARDRGCLFDSVFFTWDKPECHDAALVEEFRQEYRYKYYADRQQTEEVLYEVVVLGQRNLWSSWDQHLMHCLYAWKKLHRAYDNRGPVDSYIGSLNHSHHCGEQLLEQIYTPTNLTLVNSLISVKYPTCWR